MYRGDKKTLTFYYPGDITADKVVFVVKEDRDLTSARLIEKENTAAGGSDDEITVESSGIYSKITVYLLPSDTQAFSAADYYYDLIREDASDSDDYETLFYGLLSITADTQTPYDDADAPTSVFYGLVKRVDWVVVDGVVTKSAIFGFDDPDNVTAELDGNEITLSSTAEFNYEGYALIPQRAIDTIVQASVSSIVITIDDATGTFTIRWESYY